MQGLNWTTQKKWKAVKLYWRQFQKSYNFFWRTSSVEIYYPNQFEKFENLFWRTHNVEIYDPSQTFFWRAPSVEIYYPGHKTFFRRAPNVEIYYPGQTQQQRTTLRRKSKWTALKWGWFKILKKMSKIKLDVANSRLRWCWCSLFMLVMRVSNRLRAG